MNAKKAIWILTALLVGTCLGPAAAGPAEELDPLLDRLPAETNLVLVLDLQEAGRQWGALLDKLQSTAVVAETPELRQLFVAQRAMLDAGLAALRVELGFDPLRDLGLAVVGVSLGDPDQPGLVAVVRGKLPDGLAGHLAKGAEPERIGAAVVYPLDDDLRFSILGDLLVIADPDSIAAAVADGPGLDRERFASLVKPRPKGFLMRLELFTPAWLREAAGGEEFKAVASLVRSLQVASLQVDEQLRLELQCADPAGAERAELVLKGWREFVIGGAHFWRAYALLALGLDFGSLPELPPPLRAALANRAAIRKTIDELLPAPADVPRVARVGNRVEFTSPPQVMQGGLFLTGIGAAVAIPAFSQYIRRAKSSEVYENLERCHRGVVDFYDRPRAERIGTVVTNALPPGMRRPVCPGGGTIAELSDEPARFKPEDFSKGGPAEALARIGLVFEDPSYACYQLTLDPPGSGSGLVFTCHAWTDLDGDGQPAHWTKRGTLDQAEGVFHSGPVERDPASGQW